MQRLATSLIGMLLLIAALAVTPAMAASVRVTVNNEPITDVQIAARAALMRAERRGSSNSARNKMATEELIDDQLKLQEAERLGVSVSNAQVEEAYLSVARNMSQSSSNLDKLLLGAGVDPQTLRDRLRANIAWQGVSARVISPRVQVSDLELEKQAEEKLTDYNSYDYILKEVRFIIPQGGRVSTGSRTAQANQYRSNFQGCESAVELSMSYTDAAVMDIGRRHATQMPEAMAKELASLNVGGITKPRVVDGGVSMLAVCAKSAAEDTTFIKNQLEREQGTEKLQAEAEAYLAKLREEAAIFYK